jgi:hypothetical protein
LGTHQTIAGWVNLDHLSSDYARVIGKGDFTNRNYALWLHLATGKVSYQVCSSGGACETALSDGAVSPGQWYHVAGTYDGAMLRVYINGQEEGSMAYTQTPCTTADPLTIGYAGYHTPFSGNIDEVKLYGRALSVSEIQVLAEVGDAGAFVVDSYSEGRAPLTARDDKIVELDGQYLFINVGASPELNYGIGDFTVTVKTRTSTSSAEGEFAVGVYKDPRRGVSPKVSAGSHVAIGVRQGKELFLYLDGSLQAQKRVGNGKITRLKVNVGLDEIAAQPIIEDVNLSPSALSPEEIMGLQIAD